MTDEQLIGLKHLAKSMNYGSGPAHAKQVERLSLIIYQGLVNSGLMENSENERRILSASAWLHNVGLPDKKHNETAFDILKNEIPKTLVSSPLPTQDFSAVLYGVLWHRGNKFKKRDDVKLFKRSNIKKLASIIRIADALDRSFEQIVEEVTVNLEDNSLQFILKSISPAEAEKARGNEKADLLREAFEIQEVSFDDKK